MARLVTVFGRVNHLGAEPGTQAYSAWACPGWMSTPGSKRAYRVIHQPVSRVAVFAGARLSGGLAEISADLQETVAHLRRFATMHYINPRGVWKCEYGKMK